jgi:CheY-like chemotaxis protein
MIHDFNLLVKKICWPSSGLCGFSNALQVRHSGKQNNIVNDTLECQSNQRERGLVIIDQLHRVLIIDDDPSVRRMLVRSLRLSGFETTEAPDGQIGVERALEVQPSAILLDLMLPGESGLEVLERLRNRGISAPVVILSGNDEHDTRDAVKRSSANAYLVKPVSIAELTEHLTSLIGAAPPQA